MKETQAWITSDGEIHLSLRDAMHHADKRYGLLLSALAHEAARIGKYSAMMDWLDTNGERFQELAALRADMVLQETNDE